MPTLYLDGSRNGVADMRQTIGRGGTLVENISGRGSPELQRLLEDGILIPEFTDLRFTLSEIEITLYLTVTLAHD